VDIEREYREAVKYAEKNLASAALFAFNSNVDFICRINSGFKAEGFPQELMPLVESIKRGEAREFKITKHAAEWIAESFSWREKRIGGQAGIMANAAAALGVKSFAYAAALSEEQEKLFSKKVVVFGGAKGSPSRHFIFEFKKGTVFGGAAIPSSNRVIASYDPANFKLKISKKFALESARIAPFVECAVISGFHNLDDRIAADRIATTARFVQEWRNRNPSIRVHLELGDFANKRVLRKTLDTLLPCINSVGMNEMEAEDVIVAMGMHESEMEELADEVVVHEARGSMIYGKNKRASIVKAALFGHALAAFKAENGKDASIAALKKFVENRHEFFEFRGVPAIKVEPRFTVGLGDTFAAGFVLVK